MPSSLFISHTQKRQWARIARHTAMATYKQDAAGCLTWFALIIIFALVIWWLLPDSLTDKVRYSNQYDVPMSQVKRETRPSNCDWDFAPLGKKGCHYEKVVTGSNSSGDRVAGTDAPVFSTDVNTGKPIVSYDQRKTWQLAPEGMSTNVTEVDISWTKVDDE